jgi:hypothetical protein
MLLRCPTATAGRPVLPVGDAAMIKFQEGK